MLTLVMVYGAYKMRREKYFGVDANQVTIGEAATIVGMLKGPAFTIRSIT